MSNASTLAELAQKLRRISILSTTEAQSGHPTSCMSAAELVAVLFFDEMHFDPRDPDRPGTDSFVLSKGHAAPILWAVLHEAGAIREDPMTLRKHTSPLEGHPTPRVPWVKVSTGSLGQGICAALGMALGRRLKQDPGRVYTLLGDSEVAEGSVWEAAEIAAYHKADNLVAIVDVNGLGQSGATQHGHDTAALAAKFRAFGWHAIELEGHDIGQIQQALAEARKTQGQPTALLARTDKGHGVSFLSGKDGWHGKPIPRGPELDRALAEIGDPQVKVEVPARTRGAGRGRPAAPLQAAAPLAYRLGEEVATREAYGAALVRLGAVDPRIVVLDAEVKNSTFADRFKKAHEARFIECLIAEQNMVGMAMGLGPEGFVPFASSFAAFLTRAYDFIRMAAYSAPSHLILCGSHSGVSIGEDGPSQMGLEDLAMMRALIGATVLYPSDAVSTERLVEQAIDKGGLVYIRTSRPKTRVIYDTNETFPIGGSKVVRQSPGDVATIVGAGVTLFEALAAHEVLARRGIAVRVIDAYSIKPLDAATLQRAADETGAILTVEDHAAWGGLGDAVAAEVRCARLERLAVSEVPRSGTPRELIEAHGISSAAIVAAIERLPRRS
ncbi:MAG TPA: transketolase [Polyangia bacterium]|jgi:transketolase|nr:transketolase [Polyangia bacterium]